MHVRDTHLNLPLTLTHSPKEQKKSSPVLLVLNLLVYSVNGTTFGATAELVEVGATH